MIFGNLIGVEIFFLIAGGAIALFAVFSGAWSLRCFLFQAAHDVLQFVYSAKQLALDHERSRNELEFEQSKNDLEIEAARQRLHHNRKLMIQEMIEK